MNEVADSQVAALPALEQENTNPPVEIVAIHEPTVNVSRRTCRQPSNCH